MDEGPQLWKLPPPLGAIAGCPGCLPLLALSQSPEFALGLGPERVPLILLLISFGVSETHHKTVS